MSLIHPTVLWGLLLAAIPILIHLLIRHRYPRVRWATMDLVLAALRKNRRRILIQTIILLVLRTLIIAVMVIVIARPVIPGAWSLGADRRQPSVSVFVIDDSSSMAASLGTETAFQRAAARARQVLGELGEDSLVALVLAAHPPRALVPQPTRDMVFIEQELSRLEPRDSALDLPAALETARTILAAQQEPNHEVVIFTDGQRNGWGDRADDVARELRALADAGCSLFALLTPAPAGENAAITAVTPEEGIITTGAPTTFRVHVRNYATEHPVELPVELLVDGEKVARRVAELPPGRETVIPLRYRLPFPGRHALEARIGADVLERDNARFSVRAVYDRIPILLVDGNPQPETYRSAGAYLEAALAPIDPDDPTVQPLLDVERKPFDRVGGLGDPRVIVLAEVDTPSPPLLRDIQTHVRAGTGLLVIASSGVRLDDFRATYTSGDSPLLSLSVAGVTQTREGEEPLRLRLATPLHPALAVFEDAGLRSILARVPFPAHLGLADLAGTSRVLARFTDGSPALIESEYGEGRVIVFTGGADRETGSFPLSPAFVPFFRELVLYLVTTGERDGDRTAGDTLTWRDPGDPSRSSIVRPDGTSESAARFVEEDASGARRVVYPEADRAGSYALRTTTTAGQTQETWAAVNPPLSESELAMLSADELRHAFPKAGWVVVEPEGAVREALRRGRFGTELWPWALLILVGLVVMEAILGRLFAPKPVNTQAIATAVR